MPLHVIVLPPTSSALLGLRIQESLSQGESERFPSFSLSPVTARRRRVGLLRRGRQFGIVSYYPIAPYFIGKDGPKWCLKRS